jgi:hypothetical protein
VVGFLKVTVLVGTSGEIFVDLLGFRVVGNRNRHTRQSKVDPGGGAVGGMLVVVGLD